jgi:hypothetical protein
MRAISTALLLFAASCGTDTAEPSPDAGMPSDGYTTLIQSTWSLSANTEQYRCIRLTATTDTFIKSIRPLAPVGTHHTVLMIGPPDGPDGDTECSSVLTKPAIYASGVGTEALDMPDGVAIHIRPGQQLLLNLHLFDLSDDPITGTSGIQIMTTDPVDAAHEAGVILAGKTKGLVVPVGASTQTGTCTVPSAGITVFAIAPHMHLLGTHMTVTYSHDTTPATLLDTDYSFDNQNFRVMQPAVTSAAGDQMTIACSYMNETGADVLFGESTENEMCFALTFIYPAQPVTTCVK